MTIDMQKNSRSTLIFVNHPMSEKIYQIETQSVFNNCCRLYILKYNSK